MSGKRQLYSYRSREVEMKYREVGTLKSCRKLRIVSQTIINADGVIISNNPKDFPYIVDRCKLVVTRLDTGINHKLV
ncbi:hypothetical protein D3C76_422080 [compost metagenome]